MNKFLRAIFILIILAMLSAAIIQIFLPHLLGEKSAYGLSIHWQREISLWSIYSLAAGNRLLESSHFTLAISSQPQV